MTTHPTCDYIEFHQYGSSSDADKLILFAASASDIHAWAGIPRKGWRIRMLYQRGISARRQREVSAFWSEASKPTASGNFILGPTAITIALQQPPHVGDGKLVLPASQQYHPKDGPKSQLAALASRVLPTATLRLSPEQTVIVNEFRQNPFQELPDVDHDYVLEFCLQLTQMAADPDWFVSTNELADGDISELVLALDALCRPALVVDGQHRLLGAAHSGRTVLLPCVAMPQADWLEQIYQFIVINEKAERVETTILTDIFGSSLTRHEQRQIRDRLARAGVEVESRIAAVIAGRDPNSPFKDMVRLKLENSPATNTTAGFISDTTIRLLIDGRSRGSHGWRSDDAFYQGCVAPTFPDRADWDAWSTGRWREYWFAFWSEVRDYYNAQAMATGHPPLWGPEQSNLTKAVTLRLFQRLFMEKAVERVAEVRRAEAIIREELGDEMAELAEAKMKRRLLDAALPANTEDFRVQIRSWFLDRGVPVRVFTKKWVRSLDDQEGQQNLYDELKDAFEAVSTGRPYVARNKFVFSVDE